MNKLFLILVGLWLSCSSVWGQITASTPPAQETVQPNKYLPQEDLELLKEMSLGEQGMPTALMIDPGFITTRLSKIQNQIPLVYNQYTHQFVEYFAFKKVDFTRRMLEKRDMYFPLYEKYLKQYNLPEELKYLSLIESGLETKAISNKGAGGLWQFMPYTARGDFGLRVDGVVDERFDPEKATEAACKYLKQLHRIFGDWHLALAAYNTGPGNVKRAIRKCGRSDFWGIYNCLPKQTRAYVPQFIAMTYMMNFHWEHSIVAEKWVNKVPADTIQVKGYMNLNRLKKFANIPDNLFKEVNPHIMASIIPNDNKLVVIHIPSSNFSFFKENRQSILDSAGYVSPSQLDSLSKRLVEKLVRRTYQVKRGQSLKEVAHILGMGISELKKVNRLRSNRIKRGKKLIYFVRIQVPVQADWVKEDSLANEETPTAVSSKRSKAKKARVRYHKVRNGDTLSEIADRYSGLTVSKLKRLNHLRSSTNLRLGQRLRIN